MRAIKLTARRTIELSVLDEVAAVTGERPLEQVADSSGYAVGGVAVQLREDLRGFEVLATHSTGLTLPQQAWAPLSLETYAQLEVRRAVKGMIGPLRCVMWTDHSNLTRLQTSEEIQPKHLRWLSELLADGSVLRSLSGRSAKLADGLSRNPPERDELLAQRTKDLQGLIGQLRGFSLEEFLRRVIPWSLLSDVESAIEPKDLVTGKTVRPGSLGRIDQDSGAGGGDAVSAYPVCSFSRVMADSGAIPVLKVLYVPDYCTHAERTLKTTELSKVLSRSLPGFQARVALGEPPFEDLEGTGLHFEKQGKARLTGRKLANAARVDLFTSVAKLLRELVTHRPAVVVGRGQGAVVVLAASKPVVVEAALLARVFQRDECREVAAAWGAVKLAVAEVPRLGRAKPGWTVLWEACPELCAEHPLEPWLVEAVLPKSTPRKP